MAQSQAIENHTRGGILGDRLPDTFTQRATHESLSNLTLDLHRFFGVDFSIFGVDGARLSDNDVLGVDAASQEDMIDEVVFASAPVLRLADDDHLLLGIPIEVSPRIATVCIGMFSLTRDNIGQTRGQPDLKKTAVSSHDASFWNNSQLQRTAECFCECHEAQQTRRSHLAKIETLSAHVVHTLEEITLVYELVDLLASGIRPMELVCESLQRIAHVYPVQCAWLWSGDLAAEQEPSTSAESQREWISSGGPEISQGNVYAAIRELRAQTRDGMLIANQPMTDRPLWPVPVIKQFGAVPVAFSNQPKAWLGVCNRTDNMDVGSVEMSMLKCVARLISLAE